MIIRMVVSGLHFYLPLVAMQQSCAKQLKPDLYSNAASLHVRLYQSLLYTTHLSTPCTYQNEIRLYHIQSRALHVALQCLPGEGFRELPLLSWYLHHLVIFLLLVEKFLWWYLRNYLLIHLKFLMQLIMMKYVHHVRMHASPQHF